MMNKIIKKLTYLTSITLVIIIVGVNSASAAKLYFYPQTIDIFEGETALIEVRLDTEGDSINASRIEGNISNNLISLESINISNDIFPIFVENRKVDNKTFRFMGGAPDGFIGDSVVGRLTIRGEKIGSTVLSFDSSSKVLENAPDGVVLDTTYLNGIINIIAKDPSYITLTSRTHPDQNTWYKASSVNIHWDKKENKEYSYIVTRNQTENPDNTPDTPEGDLLFLGDIKLGDLSDGIYYFSIKEVGGDSVSRFRILIDTVNPTWTNVVVSDGIPETDGRDFISFIANDSLSGISRYEISLDGVNFENTESPYLLPDTYSNITLRAYDKAGNFIERTEKAEEPLSVRFIYTISILIIIGFLVTFGDKFRKVRLKNKSKT